MLKKQPIITVGTGHHFQRNLAPALARLEAEGRIEHVATVDILERLSGPYFENVPHLRRNGLALSKLLEPYQAQNPIVILGHTNSLHVPDAIDLIAHGFRIFMEKPYALTRESLKDLVRAVDLKTCAFLEYYMAMKSVPLLLGYGLVDEQSFYVQESLCKELPHLKGTAPSVKDFVGALPVAIGAPLRVEVEILEGEGETGTLEGRGVDTFDIRSGGGMLQDMGINALIALSALESVIGRLPEASGFAVQTARADEYMKMVARRFALARKYIGETYAEFSYTTDIGIPVSGRVGKYVFGDRNRRGVRIMGSKGELYLDWNTCTLYVNAQPILSMEKGYYPVLRAALAQLGEEPLYSFDPLQIAAQAQEGVFALQSRAAESRTHVYMTGTPPEAIFNTADEVKEKIGEEDIRPDTPHDSWVTLLGKELPTFFPVSERKDVSCPGCHSAQAESEFVKLGFVYKWCKNCHSLYVSPRPSETAITAFYADSEASRFYGKEIFIPALEARRTHQIAPLTEWVGQMIAAHVPQAARALDFMPKYFSVWAGNLSDNKKVHMVNPVHLSEELPKLERVTPEQAQNGAYDVITAFDVLDHRASPDETLRNFSRLSAPGGLLLLGLNSGSGFEYQILSRDAQRLVPPNRLNLLTVEAVEQMLEKHGYEVIEATTPGKLDVDIVLKTFMDDTSLSMPRFISYLLNKRGAKAWEAFQAFLQQHQLSSYLRVAARKK